MKCDRVRRLLPLAVGRDLDPGMQSRVERHLTECLACFRELRALRDGLSPLSDLAAPEHCAAPAGLSDSILDAVARARDGEPGPAAPVSATLLERLRFLAPLAAVFVAFAFAGYFVGGQGGRTGASGPLALDAAAHGSPADRVGVERTIVIPVMHPFPDGAEAPVPPRPTPRTIPIPPWLTTPKTDDF